MRYSATILIAVLIGFVSIATADTLVMTDGTRVVGDVKKVPEGYRVIGDDGKVTNVPADKVASIELGSGDKTQSSAALGLASLRRSVEYSSDIKQTIDRYQRFIDNTKDTKVVED